MQIHAHRLDVRQVQSPYQDDRPDNDIDLIVIHSISLPAGHFSGNYVEALFTGCLDTSCHADFEDLAGVEVSSHLFIRRSGEVIQFVDFDKRAWHAGESRFGDRIRCNDFSIGIELEGTDHNRYRDVQYDKLITVCRLLIDEYSIPRGNVVGHAEIAPGRKMDPGPTFNWQRLKNGLERI